MIVLTESSTPVQFNINSSTGYSYIGTTTANAATFVSIPSSLQVRQSSYTYHHLGLHAASSPSHTISVIYITTTANGNYTISHRHPNGKIYVSVYGFSHYGGYGYPAGMLLDLITVSRYSTQHVNNSSVLSVSHLCYQVMQKMKTILMTKI